MSKFRSPHSGWFVPLLIVAEDEHDFHRFLFTHGLRLDECLQIRSVEQLQFFSGETVMFTPEAQKSCVYQMFRDNCKHFNVNCIDIELETSR